MVMALALALAIGIWPGPGVLVVMLETSNFKWPAGGQAGGSKFLQVFQGGRH